MKRIVLVLTLCLAMLMPAFGASQDTIQRPRLPQRYLNYSGVSSLNIVNLGYTYSFKDNMHMIEIGALSLPLYVVRYVDPELRDGIRQGREYGQADSVEVGRL